MFEALLFKGYESANLNVIAACSNGLCIQYDEFLIIHIL